MKALAINIGANTNLPGLRAPVYNDRTFKYIPIPERQETWMPSPTYSDLDLELDALDELSDVEVHLDPEFNEYPCCSRYTYGDEHGVKASPISKLDRGDALVFYATLDEADRDGWGAYIIGYHLLAEPPLCVDSHAEVPRRYWSNAHFRRERFDARVLTRGDPDESHLFTRALRISGDDGAEPGIVVCDLSSDSGSGPWFRRPLWFKGNRCRSLFDLFDEKLCV